MKRHYNSRNRSTSFTTRVSFFPLLLLCFASGFFMRNQLVDEFFCSFVSTVYVRLFSKSTRGVRESDSSPSLPLRKVRRDLLYFGPTSLQAGSRLGTRPLSWRSRTRFLPAGSLRSPTRSSRPLASANDSKVSPLAGHGPTPLPLIFEHLSILYWSFFLKESVLILNTWNM